MNPFKDDEAHAGLSEALAESLPDMAKDDMLTIHDADCWYGDGDTPCTCEPLVIYGPSGKA